MPLTRQEIFRRVRDAWGDDATPDFSALAELLIDLAGVKADHKADLVPQGGLYCCSLGCVRLAEWQIQEMEDGRPRKETDTHACSMHLAEMIGVTGRPDSLGYEPLYLLTRLDPDQARMGRVDGARLPEPEAQPKP